MIYLVFSSAVVAFVFVSMAARTYATEKKAGYLNNYYPLAIAAGVSCVIALTLALIHWL